MPKLHAPKPPDPRPSKAHPEHRRMRKELEKKSGGFEWVPWLGLALTGLAVAFNVEKDVKRCEEKKERQQQRDSQQGERGGRGQSSRRDRDRSSGRDWDRDNANAYDRYRDHGREDREPDGRRLEGRHRDYGSYDGGRREYEPWNDQRGSRRGSVG